MSKTVTFEFWHLNIIHKSSEKSVSFKEVATLLERKPLDLSKENHINFSKYDRDNIKDSFFNNGDLEFDAINEIEKCQFVIKLN